MKSFVLPFAERHPALWVPPAKSGCLTVFEANNVAFTDVITTEAADLGRRIGRSRAVAASLQSDVAEWLEDVWGRLDAILPLPSGGAHV